MSMSDTIHDFGNRLLIGLVKLRRSKPDTKTTREEIAKFIDDFVDGTGGDWDFDDYTSMDYADPLIKEVMDEVTWMDETHPAKRGHGFCNSEGLARMKELAEILSEPGRVSVLTSDQLKIALQIEGILGRVDPEELIEAGWSADQYRVEATSLAKSLQPNMDYDEIRNVLLTVWKKRFCFAHNSIVLAELAGKRLQQVANAKLDAIAEDLVAVMNASASENAT